MKDAKSTLFDLGATPFFQRFETVYGKASDEDFIALDPSMESATINPIGVDKELNGGDCIYVRPSLISKTITGGSAGATIDFEFHILNGRRGFEKKEITLEFTGLVSSASDLVSEINAMLITESIDDYFNVEVVSTDKVRIQSKKHMCNFLVTGGNGNQFPTDERGKYYIFTVQDDVTAIDTTVVLNKLYISDSETRVDTDLMSMHYEVLRDIGECTGSDLTAKLSPEIYYGNEATASQVEYGSGEASISVDELAFSYENLSHLKGWDKKVGATFFSGKTATKKFSLMSSSYPKSFNLVGIRAKQDGIGMIEMNIPKCVSTELEIAMSKSFRTNSDTFNIMKDSDKTIAQIVFI